MSRKLFFIYGLGCHLMFLLVYAYMAAFVGNLWVPKSIDSATSTPAPVAIAISFCTATFWS